MESFYEELKRRLDQFFKHHMKIMLEDFNAEVQKQDIFKPLGTIEYIKLFRI
jgi:hypothetical protein